MTKKGLVLVTGASSGIGEAIAKRLHEEGYTVLRTGRNEVRLNQLQSELKGSTSFVCDLRKSQDIKSLVSYADAYVNKHSAPLVGLVNNAGIFERRLFVETDTLQWKEMFETNFFAPVELTRELYPLLSKSQGSSVLNISSSLGVKPVAQTSAYSASKAAMISWTKALAIEWADKNIRVNCVCPGLVDTPIHSFHNDPENSEMKKSAHSMQPLKRMGKPEDIAEAVAFLISEKSSWTTGSAWTVDGGISLL